jgi:predicted ATPase
MSGIIAVSGTHGTGKTTTVFQFASQLKVNYPEKTVITLTEQASLAPFPLNKKATKQGQAWIFHSHIAKELELLSKFDLVVSDRCAVDMIAYCRYLKFDDLAESMFATVQHHLPVYREIHLKFLAQNQFWFNDGLRESEDSKFREEIEEILLGVYLELGLEFTRSPEDSLMGCGLCVAGVTYYNYQEAL